MAKKNPYIPKVEDGVIVVAPEVVAAVIAAVAGQEAVATQRDDVEQRNANAGAGEWMKMIAAASSFAGDNVARVKVSRG